ncbi:DUF4097 family beta strand repeat-containing protein [Clostridium intestinale]|uniref:DUF4097 family beta strand repeat-containing protein n=1 Tax=Clostridium intestinale TaxID=36845 RepID=UPI0028E45220|nr:DUF4097 family beta strand repeat-containing protein [Clostridium intestinale]
MKKKLSLFSFSIILIIICIISYTGVIISLLSSNISVNDLSKLNININSFFNRNTYTYGVDSTESNSLDGIDSVNLNFVTGNITIETWDKNEVSVSAIGNVSTNNSIQDFKLEKTISGNQVTFSFSNSINLLSNLFNSGDMSIKVFIPNNYNKNLNISSTSSYININNNSFNSIDIKTISGDLELMNINTKSINSSSTSGNISFNNVATETSTIENISGSVYAQNFSGNINCKTVSGDINVDFNSFNNDYKFSTVSGYTNLTIPSSASFALTTETLSGSISNEFGSNNNSNSKIRFNSTSGDLSINKK